MSRQVYKEEKHINYRRMVFLWILIILMVVQGTTLTAIRVNDSLERRSPMWITKNNFTTLSMDKLTGTIEDFPNIQWNRTYGGAESDYIESVIQTIEGFVFIGSTRSSGAGDYDGWLVKVDGQGEVEWQKTFGDAEYNEANSVIQTMDGGFAFVGTTFSATGDFDGWLVKTDGRGEMEWQKTYGGTQIDGASVIIETEDGGFVFAGSTRSSGAGDYDGWLVKTDAEGEVEWQQTFGGSETDVLRSLIKTADNGFALVGYTSSSGAGGWDAWLVKIDAHGVIQWDQSYGEDQDDAAWFGIQTVDDGGYALIGFTQSYGASSRDFWLIKADAGGKPQWNRTYGGIEYDEAWTVIETADAGFFITGSTWSFGTGDGDVMLTKTDAQGEVEWQQTFGGPETDEARAFIQAAADEFVIAGYTYSYGAGDRDAWLLKIGPPVTTTMSSLEELTPDFQVIPVLLGIPVLLWFRRRRRRRR